MDTNQYCGAEPLLGLLRLKHRAFEVPEPRSAPDVIVKNLNSFHEKKIERLILVCKKIKTM